MSTLKKKLLELIKMADTLGLEESEIKHASEFLDYNEYGLSLDTLLTQIYEFNIEINYEFYEKTSIIANKMKLPEESYIYIKELINE